MTERLTYLVRQLVGRGGSRNACLAETTARRVVWTVGRRTSHWRGRLGLPSPGCRLVDAAIPASCIGMFGLATPDWAGRLIQLESVGGRGHESQCIRIGWSGGDAAYRNGRTVAFSRHALRERDWHIKVLRRYRSHRKTV